MSYLILGLILPAMLLIGAAYLHIRNLSMIHERLEELMEKPVSLEEYYKELTIPQGANFTALAMSAWMMLFVAIASLNFLIPTVLPFSYMTQMAEWASKSFGIFVFGFFVAVLAAIFMLVLDKLSEKRRNLKLIELYSFYSVSKAMKKYTILTIPLSCISIFLSASLITIYPEQNSLVYALSSTLLVCSIVVLVWPIWKGRK